MTYGNRAGRTRGVTSLATPSKKQRIKAAAPRISAADSRRVKPPEKRADPFYTSAAWRALMARLIAQRGRQCEDPDHDPSLPRKASRVFGDHIRELRDGGSPLDPRNIMLRCGSCHTRKTSSERARRLRG